MEEEKVKMGVEGRDVVGYGGWSVSGDYGRHDDDDPFLLLTTVPWRRAANKIILMMCVCGLM